MKLINVEFRNNRARDSGGAIWYDAYRPSMTNVTFTNNTAPYGPNIASYAVKALLVSDSPSESVIYEAASGQVHDGELKFRLSDYDNQTFYSQTSGLMSLTALDSSAKALGLSTAPIVQGITTFKDVIFQAEPGSQNVEFTAKAFSIDSQRVQKVFGVSSLDESFFVNFRY